MHPPDELLPYGSGAGATQSDIPTLTLMFCPLMYSWKWFWKFQKYGDFLNSMSMMAACSHVRELEVYVLQLVLG